MFLTIIFFPTVIVIFSLIQWRLDKRKHARMDAAKARAEQRRLARRLVANRLGGALRADVGATSHKWTSLTFVDLRRRTGV